MPSSTGLFYFFEAVISFGIAYKFFKTYQKTRNEITKNFAFLFFFFIFNFLFWSLPTLIIPGNLLFLNLGSLIGEGFIFIAFAFGMRSFVATKFPRLPQNLVSGAVLLIGAIVVYLNSSIFGSSFLNPHGVIEWRLHPVAIAIYSVTIIALCLPLCFEFFRLSLTNENTRVRSLLFAFSALFGIGSVLVIGNIPWQIISLGHVLLAVGFACMGFAVFFTRTPTE